MKIKRAIDAKHITVSKKLASDVLKHFAHCRTEQNREKLRTTEMRLVAKLINALQLTNVRGVGAMHPDNTRLFSADVMAHVKHFRLCLRVTDNLNNAITPYNVWVHAE